MTTRKSLAAGAVGLLMTLALAGQAFAYTTTSQYAASDFATGFSDTNIGPIGLAFDASNHLYVMEYPEGILHKFGTSGGAALAGPRGSPSRRTAGCTRPASFPMMSSRSIPRPACWSGWSPPT